jgi:flagellar hook-basal body complex protein FliE
MSDPIGAAAQRIARVGLDIGTQRIPVIRPSEGPSFADTLKDALGEVSAAQETAADQVGKFLRGEPVELHQVMAATEEAGLAIDMLVELRNKVTDAYRALINMQ